MPDNRRFIAISLFCLILVILALIANTPDLPARLPNLNAIKTTPTNLSTSDNFYEQSDPKKTGETVSIKQTPVPKPTSQATNEISARSYLVGNVATKEVYDDKNTDLVLPVASMSKLITAMEALDKMPAEQRITITEAVAEVPYGSNMFSAGETLTVHELLYPLLMSSSNMAAEALASTSDRIAFLEAMSSYSWEIGMPKTYFADPSGLSPRNLSTAADFFALAQYLYSSRRDILSITRTINYSLATTSDHARHEFTNIHPFVGDPDFLGGKTGHTDEARDTMLTIMNIGGQPVAIIVLGSEDRQNDTRILITKVRKKLGIR